MKEYPEHIGIIMDGNGRWAVNRKLSRTTGHKQGITTAKKIIKEAIRLHIPYLTLYVFSTENWTRTAKEVGFLMKLIIYHMRTEASFYRKNKIRVLHTGDMSRLPDDVQKEIKKSIENTADNDAITVILAINYGGRDEITRSVRRWLQSSHNKQETLFSEEDITANLDNKNVPDPDLIIRTAGEQRLSNFLLWESAYSEYYFTDTLWPDFKETDLQDALNSYAGRDRKFGGVKT